MPWPLGFADPAPQPPSPEAALGTVASEVEDPVDPALADYAGAHETIADEVNATLLVLLPWGISALLHAGVVLLAVFIVWTVVVTADDDEVIIPVLELSATPAAPLQAQTEQRIKTQQRERAPTPQKAPTKPTETVDLSTALIGLAGPSPKATPFGVTVAGPQLQSSFMGNRGGNAKRIVFLIDAGGSIVDTFPFVINELTKSIRKLSEKQRFTVIFFNGVKDVIEPPPGRLQAATLERKQSVMAWIDLDAKNVRAEGSGYPIPALKKALSYRPQLIYLLSDDLTGTGQFELMQKKLLKEVRDANRSDTKINTIQFIYKDPFQRDGDDTTKGTLQRIAEDSGGNYKFVSAEDLNIE